MAAAAAPCSSLGHNTKLLLRSSEYAASRLVATKRALHSSNNPLTTHPSWLPNSPIYFVFGSNTDVGKTVLTTGLLRAAATESSSTAIATPITHYIKPLQCSGSDEDFVRKHIPNSSNISTETLFRWETPASPHYATRIENKPLSDDQLNVTLDRRLRQQEQQVSTTTTTTTWIETAGGVMSPSSSSPDNDSLFHAKQHDLWGWIPQATLYQLFASIGQVVLVGDGRLGGISATLSALDSLSLRGYSVAGILLIEAQDGDFGSNRDALVEYVSRVEQESHERSSLLPMTRNPESAIVALPPLPPEPEPLHEWYKSSPVKDKLYDFVHGHLIPSWKHMNMMHSEKL